MNLEFYIARHDIESDDIYSDEIPMRCVTIEQLQTTPSRSSQLPVGCDKKPPIFQLHFSILQKVIEYWKHVSLCFFDAFENQHPAFHRCPHCALVEVLGASTADFTTLLQIGLGSVTRERYWWGACTCGRQFVKQILLAKIFMLRLN